MKSDWATYTISDVAQRVITGKTPPGTLDEYFGGETLFVTPTDMEDDKHITETIRTLSVSGKEKLNKQLFTKGIVVSCIGWQMGKSAIVKQPSVTNQQVNTVVPDESVIDLDFLYYVLKSKREEIFNLGATATRTPILKKSLFEKISFDAPCLIEQKKIGKLLSQFDDKIQLNTQTNQTLEQMAQAIFKSWFVDFDPVKAKMNGEQPEGMDAATASLFPEKLVESELGLIPDGWEVKSFKKVIDKYVDNRGKTPPIVEDGIPLVEVKHLPESSAFPNLSTNKRVTEETFKTWFRVHVEHKDVLISTVGTIGRTSFVKNTNFGIAQNVLGLRFGKVVEPEYMFYTIKAHRFQHDMDARLVTTVQSSIKRKDLDTIDILVPPSNVQKEFCKLIGNLLDGQYSKNAENINLASLRDTLLPKLLSGEIVL
jgi:type I restriction enzyme S subunit